VEGSSTKVIGHLKGGSGLLQDLEEVHLPPAADHVDDGFPKGVAGVAGKTSPEETSEELGIASTNGVHNFDPIRRLLMGSGLAIVARLEAAVVVGVIATRLEDGVEISLRIHPVHNGWLEIGEKDENVTRIEKMRRRC